MAQITATMVKTLRERTQLPMMDCKKALEEAQGDMEKAELALRKAGAAAAAKKAGRIASEGAVGSYIHGGGKLGVLVEVNCETDFVARTAEFQELIHDIAMHIAAADPRYASREEVPAAELERERAIYREQAEASGKPPAVIEKMIEGKLEKFFAETVLVEQAFVKNPDLTVGQLLAEKVAKIGENIRVRRFVRFKLGEGLEKRSQDFAQEVAQAAAGH